MRHELMDSHLKQIAIGRVSRRLGKGVLVPTQFFAPASNLRIRKVSAKIMSETISNLRNEPQILFDDLANQPKAIAR